MLIIPAMTGEIFVGIARLDGSWGGQENAKMSEEDSNLGTDEQEQTHDKFPIDRRTALKGGAAGLAALGLGGLGINPVAAHHEPANKASAAGSNMKIMSMGAGDGVSNIETLLEIPNVKTSGSEADSLLFMPTVESSLFTRVGSNGKDNGKDKDDDGLAGWDSVAAAGVLSWIEIRGDATGGDWRMVDLEGNVTSQPPQNASDFVDENGNLTDVADKVVTLNSRQVKLEWDVQDLIDAVHELQENVDGVEYTEFDLLLDLYIKTRSSNGFNWIARTVNGVNDLRLRGALYDFTYSDDVSGGETEARAVVGNRSMVVLAEKLPHDPYTDH